MISAVLFVVLGIAWMVLGPTEVVKRLVQVLVGAILIATFLPFVRGCADVSGGGWWGWLLVVGAGLVLLGGWLRYVTHRRALQHGGGDKMSSLKRRVDRG